MKYKNKTETLSNKVLYYNHIENLVAFNLDMKVMTKHGFNCQQVDQGSKVVCGH